MEERAQLNEQAAVTQTAATQKAGTAFGIIIAIGFCHCLNDLLQSLLPAIYPTLKAALGLTFGQIGFVTLAYQLTASVLQPVVGLYADRRPSPAALPVGTLFSLCGLLVLSVAHQYALLIAGACLLGMGSSIFHPESSRVARMAAGGRHGLAQSIFQLGGNTGSAIGPLAAAFVVVRFGQTSLAFFALLALVATTVLWNVAVWYRHHGLSRLRAVAQVAQTHPFPSGKVRSAIVVLLALIFSKYVYLVSLTNYLTFYLMHRFDVSVQQGQIRLFVFLAAVAVGTIVGGPLGDRFGRKHVIWFSILGTLPFTLLLPHVNLFWTAPLTVAIGLILASAFPAIVVYAQELLPGKVGTISGLFFGFAFGIAGLGAAMLGHFADVAGIDAVYRACAFLPFIGLLAFFLPKVAVARRSG